MARHWLSKKMPVEDCLTLDINELVRNDLFRRRWGACRWTRGGNETGSVDYQLRHIEFKEGESVYILTLLSPIINRGQEISMSQDIPLVTTKLPTGGKRYWFECPNCKRRVGRLHLTPEESYFLCRQCYDLTFMSCQDSHRFDTIFAQMGIPPWLGRMLLKRNRRANVRC